MSVVAASFLNGIVIENKVHTPEHILFELNTKLRNTLQHEGAGENVPLVSDTIEMAVCRFNRSKTEMQFASAGMPVIVVSKSQISEHRGNEQRAGAVNAAQNPFTGTTATLHSGDTLFLLSDGLMAMPGSDQQQVYDLLATLKTRDDIDRFIRTHCGNVEQPDDVLVIGVTL
jgi:hypothetical protein